MYPESIASDALTVVIILLDSLRVAAIQTSNSAVKFKCVHGCILWTQQLNDVVNREYRYINEWEWIRSVAFSSDFGLQLNGMVSRFWPGGGLN